MSTRRSTSQITHTKPCNFQIKDLDVLSTTLKLWICVTVIMLQDYHWHNYIFQDVYLKNNNNNSQQSCAQNQPLHRDDLQRYSTNMTQISNNDPRNSTR